MRLSHSLRSFNTLDKDRLPRKGRLLSRSKTASERFFHCQSPAQMIASTMPRGSYENNRRQHTTASATMSKPPPRDDASSGSKEMNSLMAAAAMMATDRDDSKSSDDNEAAASQKPPPTTTDKTSKAKDVSATRARRLEQNRKAAIESRRRKKVMIGELQRSAAFYTKANEKLKIDNLALEQRLLLAKQQVMQMKAGTTADPSVELKSPPEETTSGTKASSKQPTYPSEQQPLAPICMQPTQARAQIAATQALYETMGYPSGFAKVAADTFSPCVGLSTHTGNTHGVPTADAANTAPAGSRRLSLDIKPSSYETLASQFPMQFQFPSEKEIGSDKYIKWLEKVCRTSILCSHCFVIIANAEDNISSSSRYFSLQCNSHH